MIVNREHPPLPNKSLKYRLPEIQHFILESGLKVTFVEKNNLPIVQMNLITNAGSKYDPTKLLGLSYLTSLLIDEGAGEYSALELDNEIESLGSIFGVSTDSDLIHLNMLSMKDKLSKSTELLSKIYSEPLFSEDDFIREKNKLQTKIVRNYDDPSYIASAGFKKQIYNSSQFSHPIIGESSTVDSIDNNEILEFYKDYFSLENSHLIVTGCISKDELESELENHFSIFNNKFTKNFTLVEPSKKANRLYFIHKDDAAQSEIRVGHISNSRKDPDYFSKLILNSILGGQFSSRLNLNLREDKGFTYGVSSGFFYNENFGHFQIATSVQSENTDKAIIEIDNEILGIKKHISDEEIDFAKSYLVKRFPSMFETFSQIANNLTTMIHFSLENNYFDNYINNVENCSKQDIFIAAQERIINDDLVYLVVGNRKSVLPQLNSIWGSSITELDRFGNTIE